MTNDAAAQFTHEYRVGDPEKVTLLLLHGTGGDEHDLIPLGERVLPGATLLSPRGQVSEGGALRFFRRHAEGVLDIPDLQARADQLAAWLRGQIVERGLPPRIVAVGFSNGANIATAVLFRHPGLLAGAALIRAMMTYTPDPLPVLTGTRVLLSSGRADPLVPASQVDALHALLTAAGAESSVAWQHAGHGLAPGDLIAMREWLAAF
jgi:phospholipase/carboxylesterase